MRNKQIKLRRGPFGSKDRFNFQKVSRDFGCSEYDDCLMFACQEKWKVFTCSGCTQALNLTEVSDDCDTSIVFRLIDAISSRKRC